MSGKKVVLVTGGTGLVGMGIKKVYEAMKRDDEEFVFVSTKDADLEDLGQTKALFEKYKPTYVIHLAALVGGLFKNMKMSYEFLTKNMSINTNVIKCSVDYKVKKCVYTLTNCIFPDKITFPIDETMLHNGPPSNTNYGFAYAKRYADILARAYNEKQKDTLLTGIIPTNVYGPYDNFNLDDGHVLGCLIHKAYLAKEKGEPLKVLGSGKALRQFVFSYDLAKLIVKVLHEYDHPDTIILNVDEADEISIRDAAEIVRKEFGIEQELVFDTSFGDGQIKKTATNKKLRSLWPDFKFTPFAQGIHETVKWLKENYKTAKI